MTESEIPNPTRVERESFAQRAPLRGAMAGATHGGRGRGTTAAAVLAVLVVCGVLPSGAQAISRAAAERKAMDALEIRDDTGPVVVFGTPRPVRAGTVITEAGARRA